MQRMSVVLPAPFGPTSAAIEPELMVTLTPCRARLVGYSNTRSRISIMPPPSGCFARYPRRRVAEGRELVHGGGSDLDLRAELDHAIRRQLEIVRRVERPPRQP